MSGPVAVRFTSVQSSAVEWKTTGNSGSGLLIGTTSNDTFYFIQNNLHRGGFRIDKGAFFIQDPNFTEFSASNEFVRISHTSDATPLTVESVSQALNGNATSFIFHALAVRDDAVTIADLEIRATFLNTAGVIAQVGPTTASYAVRNPVLLPYQIQFAISGTDILIQVVGDVGHEVNWISDVKYIQVSGA